MTSLFIKKSIEIHGDTYDYSKVVYENNLKEVIIICKEHGEFLQLPTNHYRYGCAKCRKPNEHNELLKKEEILKLGYNYIEIWESDWLLFIKKIKIIQKLLLIFSFFTRRFIS